MSQNLNADILIESRIDEGSYDVEFMKEIYKLLGWVWPKKKKIVNRQKHLP